jgi:hypothetical protein
MIEVNGIHVMTRMERYGFLGCEGTAYIFGGTDGTFDFHAVCDDTCVQVIFYVKETGQDVACVAKNIGGPVNQFTLEGIQAVAKRTRSTLEFLATLHNHGFDVCFDYSGNFHDPLAV